MRKHMSLFIFVLCMLFMVAMRVVPPTISTATPVREYRALVSQTSSDPYVLTEFANEIGEVSYSRNQAGIYELSIITPTFGVTNTFVMITGYNDGAATPETFEASPEDAYTIQFLHYQERTSIANNARLMLVDGYNGSTAFYIWVVVYP